MTLRSNCIICAFAVALSACSPSYLLRGTTEQYKILSNKEALADLIQNPDTAAELRRKFQLVLDARAYAEAHGLQPGGSFAEYAAIDRDVLVWVLSAAPKTSLEPYLWWFPIVGSVPYKGFFEKEDGMKEAQALDAAGYDVILRPSPAYSTLGWFDDPLLSTYIQYDDVQLVNTVFHEIFHNTVWIPNSVFFNETAANIVGYLYAEAFFKARGEIHHAEHARKRLFDELKFAAFIENIYQQLRKVYEDTSSDEAAKLARKTTILSDAVNQWQQAKSTLHTDSYDGVPSRLNNALVVALKIYLQEPDKIYAIYQESNDIELFVAALDEIKQTTEREGKDPYKILAEIDQEPK